MTDFRLSYHFNSRAELVAWGENLGKAMAMIDHPRPWFIRLDGDFNSGKSLVALAVDKGFRPEIYPDVLDRTVRIQTLMPCNYSGLHTVFHHFGHQVCKTKESFDEELCAFEFKNPQAKILIVSNLDRNYQGINDLDSDFLDIAVHVEKGSGDFERHVDLVLGKSISNTFLLF